MRVLPKNWRDDAVCFYLPEDEKEHFTSTDGWGKARQYCRKCPVIEECLLDAVRNEIPGEERFGTRGGMSANARTEKFG